MPANGMVGRTYLLRGERVRVLARWRDPMPAPPTTCKTCGGFYELNGECRYSWLGCGGEWRHIPGGAPRNVLLELEDGRRLVRPFRGLRRAS